MKDHYLLQMKVRDYECDLQGIVNNAVYLHYAEHVRNEYIRSKGTSLDALHEKGIDVVVVNVEIHYKASLCPGDEFDCSLTVEKRGIRYNFYQTMVRTSDNKLCAEVRTTVVGVVKGRPVDSPEVAALLNPQTASK